MLSELIVRQRKKGGIGGLLGKIGGGLLSAVAAAAAPFTGGTSAAAVPAVLGATGLAGGLAGGLADPGKITEGKKVGTLQSQADVNPEVGILTVQDAMSALDQLPPSPEVDETRNTFNQTLDVLNRRRGKRGIG